MTTKQKQTNWPSFFSGLTWGIFTGVIVAAAVYAVLKNL